jgi:hypothetical protein
VRIEDKPAIQSKIRDNFGVLATIRTQIWSSKVTTSSLADLPHDTGQGIDVIIASPIFATGGDADQICRLQLQHAYRLQLHHAYRLQLHYAY